MAAMFPRAGGDSAMGHCMVLPQYNRVDCIDNRWRGAGQGGLFCKHVININIEIKRSGSTLVNRAAAW